MVGLTAQWWDQCIHALHLCPQLVSPVQDYISKMTAANSGIQGVTIIITFSERQAETFLP